MPNTLAPARLRRWAKFWKLGGKCGLRNTEFICLCLSNGDSKGDSSGDSNGRRPLISADFIAISHPSKPSDYTNRIGNGCLKSVPPLYMLQSAVGKLKKGEGTGVARISQMAQSDSQPGNGIAFLRTRWGASSYFSYLLREVF